MKAVAKKLLFGIGLTVGISLPLAADTIPADHMTPDRGGRSHRELLQNLQQFENENNNVIENSEGDLLFRPDRNKFLDLDDDVQFPSSEEGVNLVVTLSPQDAPTNPVPEPGTLLLIAPAALGLLRKIRR